jgi:hypothetical protein
MAVSKGYTKCIKKEYKVVYMGLIIETRQVLYIGFLIKITIGPLEVGALELTILYSPSLL